MMTHDIVSSTNALEERRREEARGGERRGEERRGEEWRGGERRGEIKMHVECLVE